MIEQLFGSKTRVKLLQLFYGNPNRSFYVREITRKIDEQINSVRRELANLMAIGIITSDTTNNKVYYEVNQKFGFYEPLLAMFGGGKLSVAPKSAKTSSGDSAPADIKALGNVELALYTRDESSGVDLLLVGNISAAKAAKFVSELEAKEGKEIRYTVFSLDDFRYREQIKDRFVVTIKEAKKQILVDKQHLLS
jgi:hypothetical protein